MRLDGRPGPQTSATTGHAAWRAWATNAVLCLLGLGLVLLTRQWVNEFNHFWIGGSGCSGWSVWLFVAAIMVVLTQPVNRWTFGIIVAFAVAMQATTVTAEPFSSSDIYRYVWDGIVQHAHMNPYRYVPADPALNFLHKDGMDANLDVYDSINRREYARTIYPPVAQMFFWFVTYFSGTVAMMKLAMVGCLGVTAWAITQMLGMMRRRREELLLFAWCPLLAWEIGGGGHVDGFVLMLVVLALLFRFREQPALTGLFLGLAFMAKFYPGVLLPALYVRAPGRLGGRAGWKMPAVFVAVIVAGYGLYLSAGRYVFGFLGGYASEEGLDTGSRFFLLDQWRRIPGLMTTPNLLFLIFSAAVLGAIAWWCWKHAAVENLLDRPTRNPLFLRGAMAMAFAMMLLFSPHYAWYVAWLVPLFALAPNLPLLGYVMGFFYLFTTELADPGPKMFLLNQILYGGVAALLLLERFRWRRIMRLPLTMNPG